jgi:ClpP class serine protease
LSTPCSAVFTGAVREARGFDDDSLAKVTTGEVWLADEALELRLIDGVCDEEAALDEAQKLAGMPRRSITRLQSRRTLMQRAGMPMAGMGPPGPRWLAELEGWMHTPRARLL